MRLFKIWLALWAVRRAERRVANQPLPLSLDDLNRVTRAYARLRKAKYP